MALVVEDGTGVDGANSYGTVAEADAYWADRNVLTWAGASATNADKEGFMIEGADYLNQFYVPKGEPVIPGHSMGLPVLSYDGIPIPWKQAQFILAREAAINGPLAKALGDRLVTSERKKLDGVGEKEVQYERTRTNALGRVGSIVDAMLQPYVVNLGGIQQARVDYA